MNLWTNIVGIFRRGLFTAPPPSTMRNKPGGLARVKLAFDEGDGSYAIQGQFVKTVRLDRDSFWVIDPPLEFIVRAYALTSDRRIAKPGAAAIVESMHDDLLEPIREIGDDERDESAAWLPPVPLEAQQPKAVPA
jgi:hypothetical protein